MNNEQSLRDHLADLLDWENAHAKFDDVVKDFPSELRGKRPPGGQHSAWELLEHLRLAIWDILEYTLDAKGHKSPKWPEGYWPSSEAPPNDAAWDESVAEYRKHLARFVELARSADLFAPLSDGSGKTPLRELLLAADHNAWHLGQLMMVRRMMGA